jgi:hypothetical protein
MTSFVIQLDLAIDQAPKICIFRRREWAVIYSQLMIYFGDRLAERD